MAWMQLHRTERSVAIAVLAHLATRHFIATQVDNLKDPEWGVAAAHQEQVAAYLATKSPGHDAFFPGPLRDAQLPIACLFHTAGRVVEAGLRGGADAYEKFAWVPGWISSSAAVLATYPAEFTLARVGTVDGGERLRQATNRIRKFFEREAEDAFCHGAPPIAGNLGMSSQMMASWVLANPELSPEVTAGAVLRDLRQVVMPASHVNQKTMDDVAEQPLDLDKVVTARLGRVVESADRTRRYADEGLTAPSPAGDRQCAGHRLGPSGGAADAAVVDRFYRAIAEAVSPDGAGVEVGDTPSPETGLRDRTFLRPTEVATAAYTLACYRNGVFPALTQTARRVTGRPG